MRRNLLPLIIILAILAFSVSIVIPKGPNFGKEIKAHLGLDLQGGAQLIYEIDTSNTTANETPTQIQQRTIDIITRRVDGLGVSEPKIQGNRINDKYGVMVELPGIKDIQQAKSLIGKTAQLKFYEQDESGQEKETGLTGSDIKKALPSINQNGGGFSNSGALIELEFSSDGAKKFQEVTKRNIGKPLITKLDDQVVNIATVRTEIDGGKAVIEGLSSLKEAKETARLINEGALPAPIELVQESNIGASLGKDAIEKSLVAGIIGLLLVAVFMILYYGGLGVVAIVALVIYSIVIGALFKLIPVTLTLSGIAGFIFSIGIAVDANILVFERFKEEKKKGLGNSQALENGFVRSWPSIRDSNVASLITSVILFYSSSGMVKGFALTLGLGVLVSIFSAIFVTRTILRFFIKNEHN